MRESTSKELSDALRCILEHPEGACFIHYSCTDIYEYQHMWGPLQEENRDKTPPPRINAIAIHSLTNEETRSFGLDFYIRIMDLKPHEYVSRRDEFEAMMLKGFYSYIQTLDPEMLYMHWNMDGDVFGFDAIARRYRVLGGVPVDFPEEHTLNLAAVIANIYPCQSRQRRLMPLIRANGLFTKSIIDGKNESTDDFVRLTESTIEKAKAIAKLFFLTARKKLRLAPKF